jgi:hypothetical protein
MACSGETAGRTVLGFDMTRKVQPVESAEAGPPGSQSGWLGQDRRNWEHLLRGDGRIPSGTVYWRHGRTGDT